MIENVKIQITKKNKNYPITQRQSLFIIPFNTFLIHTRTRKSDIHFIMDFIFKVLHRLLKFENFFEGLVIFNYNFKLAENFQK